MPIFIVKYIFHLYKKTSVVTLVNDVALQAIEIMLEKIQEIEKVALTMKLKF